VLEIVDHAAHERYVTALESHLRSYYGTTLGLARPVVERAIEQRLTRYRGTSLAVLLDELVGLAGKRLLDVGSGWGELLLACIEHGADAVALEPDEAEVHISELLLQSYGLDHRVTVGAGERLPFTDGSFDVVTCQQVLEHVADIDATVSEMVRVTRPGGSIFVSTPNYLFPYEGHYRMKWFPMTPKTVGRFVLIHRGRDPTFLIEHVNYTHYFQLQRVWRRHGLEVRNITAELVARGDHPSAIYRRPWVRFMLARLRLYPNISWLLTKPSEVLPA
jgi:2-polyprenyl-3-methyl-5-hydroxy-6-metoxy-1,4-benzoquinol methylase